MKLVRIGMLALGLAAAPWVHAQTYPSRAVTIVVPYPPGGAVDIVTRKMAAELQKETGQAFIVENKPGATGTIGVTTVVNAPPDGYTLVTNDTTYSLLPYIFKKLPFNQQKDLEPVAAFMFAPMAVAVKADSKYKALADLIKAAKAAPGTITYGTGGPGSLPDFATSAFAIAAGAKYMAVPFKGAGEATMAVLSGTVDFQIASTPGLISQVKAGTMRLLAVSGNKRPAALPQSPTFAEAGLPAFGVVNFTGMWAPKGTPPAVVQRLQAEISKAMSSPDMKAYAESIGATPGYWDGDTLGRNINERTAYWGKVAAASKDEGQ
jgi:tripartite-type tricarboxylate transporter receptor subunit TctC